jgi:nucleoside-diphosphate-sugar epimerase
VVVHLLTALPAAVLRAADLRATNRLREEGTRHLIRAALDAGSRRVVAESFMAAGVESNPASGALLSLESQLADVRNRIDTVALRFGGLYGAAVPHTRAMAAQLRAGRMFLPGGPEGRLSFVHLDDAVAAMLAVLGHSTPAPIYNVVDDEPMSAAAFLRELADAIGARRPRTLPRWVVKLAAPMVAEFASADMALDHDRLTQDLGWHPAYPSVHDGLREAAPGLREAA